MGKSDLLPIIEKACRSLEPSKAQSWHIEPAEEDGTWTTITNELVVIPEQGWKLHLSATILSAADLLHRALPVLLNDTASFKVANSIAELRSLNEGDLDLSQVGKFITVYPNDDAQAVRLAVALDRALEGLPHPDIPSDRPLRLGSVVHYRYGSFGGQQVRIATGEILPAVAAPDGTLVPDRRTVPYSQPAWAVDPFVAAGVADEQAQPSPLLKGRYLLIYTLHESARGSVHLAADLAEKRRCIVKRAAHDAQVSDEGHGACHRLTHEGEILRFLTGKLHVPEVFDLFESNGDFFLAMEDVGGETLSEYIDRLVSHGRFLSSTEVVALGSELANLLSTLHSFGLLYRDLKSSNVILAPDGRLRLVDFELAYDQSKDVASVGRGTEGYMSPQAHAGEMPTVADDVYGLGAILYFLATAAEPSVAPGNYALTNRPVVSLNPSIPPELASVIDRCLAADPKMRFPSMESVEVALKSSLTSRDVASSEKRRLSNRQSETVARDRSRMLAKRIGDSLCAVAHTDPNGGVFWASTYNAESAMERRDLNMGSAGVVLALANLLTEFDDVRHREHLREGARWLAKAPIGKNLLAGLYVGESGVAAALLRAGQVLDCGELIELAGQRARLIASVQHVSPDLYHGSAGRLRFHLFHWWQTREPEYLAYAIESGNALLRMGETLHDGGMRWTLPPGYEGLSGDTYLGYAHGAAGIGDSLLDLFDACGDERFLEAAVCAARWVNSKAFEVFDGHGLDWPAIDSMEVPAGPFWCHGATGIGKFFLRLSALDVFEGSLRIARRAASAVSQGGRRFGASLCHGLAGNIDFLIDMYQFTRDDEFLHHARSLAQILEAFAVERNGLLVWSTDSPDTITSDYMVGYAGVAMCLLRLADPESRPDLLSVEGFSWTPKKRSISCNI